MKTKLLFTLAAIISFGATGVMQAAEDSDSDKKVQITFANPEQFTDVRDAFVASEKGAAANVDMVRQYMVKQANKYVADGQKLEINVTNIDLAGDFEPWGQAGSEDVRIVKDIYPPRIDLSFKLTDEAGNVVKEGTRELRDLNFMMKLSIRRDDPLRHEKELIDDWLRKDIKSAKAG